MSCKRLVFSLLVFCIACKPAAKSGPQLAKPPASGPQVRATVVTFQTTIQPANKTLTHTLTIANGRARSSAELDSWRLFDPKQDRVTFVDDIRRTFRHESLASLLKTRHTALAGEVPATMPRPAIGRGTVAQTIAGIEATPYVISSGAYRRELWIGATDAIPPQLFPMMLASEMPSTYAIPLMRSVEETLLEVKGFPLRDHIELPVGDKKYVIDRTVTSIEQKNVPSSLLDVPNGYQEVTTKPLLPPPAPRQTLLPAGIPTVAPPPPPPPPPKVTPPPAPAKQKPAVVKAKAPATTKKAPVKKATAKKATAKKATTKKTTTKKTTTKKATAKKASAKKPAAKKAPAKKALAKKALAKKPPAKPKQP
ncbi:MAG: Histone H1-like nucleoprotein [Acidobacteria bacterium]|nr:Histone H1-like nucleoprotein [Acidobacteriota bacterium]